MKSSKTNSLATIFAVLVLIIIAICVYTFYNAKGISYLSDDSQACNNCHIMNEVYNDWSSGSHSQQIAGKPRATCNDCHLPHDGFVTKWFAKAKAGVSHAYAFTFNLDELPANLTANKDSKQTVQDNCVRCHIEYAQNVVNPTTTPHVDKSLSCVSCHNSVGHNRGF